MLWPAALAPMAVVVYAIHRYGVNVPIWDQWVLVDPLVEIELGRFPWGGVFGLQNEHRMVFPKLIMLGLAQLTGWNTLVEMWFSAALAACSLLMLLALARPALDGAGPAACLWAVSMLSALVFSLAQWENWLWGWQIQWFLGALAAISVVALTTWSLEALRPLRHLAGAAFAAIVCQYSIASGIAIWAAGAMVLAFHSDWRRLLAVWTAIAIGATAIYFIGYVKPANHPSMTVAIEHPGDYLVYVGNYLAGPLGRHAFIGHLVAAVFVLLTVASLPWLRREPRLVVPWIAIGAFAGANAAATGIGRLGMGVEQALQSRYVTIALLLPVALVPLGLIAFRFPPVRNAPRLVAAAAIGGAGLLTVLVALADLRSVPHFANEGRRLAEARVCMLRIDEASDECVGKIFPDALQMRHWHKQLQAMGWSGFPDDARQPRGSIRIDGPAGPRLWRLRPEDGPAGWFDKAVLDGDTLVASGWARHPRRDRGGVHRVVVTVGDAARGEARLVGEAAVEEETLHVAKHYSDPTLRKSGWTMRTKDLPALEWPLRFRAYLVIADDVLSPLGGSATFGEVLQLTTDGVTRPWRVLPSDGRSGALDRAQDKDDVLVVAGWANPVQGSSVNARRVIVVAGNRVIGDTETGSERPDVAAHFNDPQLERSGWVLRVDRPSAIAGPQRLNAFVEVGEGLIVPLQGEATIGR